MASGVADFTEDRRQWWEEMTEFERTAALWRPGGWSALGDGDVTVITGGATHAFGAGEAIPGLPEPRR
jgi:hypothetical protein